MIRTCRPGILQFFGADPPAERSCMMRWPCTTRTSPLARFERRDDRPTAALRTLGGMNQAVRHQRTLKIGGGVEVPYPEPSSTAASNVGRGNRRTDTKPERTLRSSLHRLGLRFRKDHRVATGLGTVRVDICFTRAKVAVFVDGCFWHGCPVHSRPPKSNQTYWGPKLAANAARDRRNDQWLSSTGWSVIRVWEHEDVRDAVDRVALVVRGG